MIKVRYLIVLAVLLVIILHMLSTVIVPGELFIGIVTSTFLKYLLSA